MRSSLWPDRPVEVAMMCEFAIDGDLLDFWFVTYIDHDYFLALRVPGLPPDRAGRVDWR